MGLNENDDDAPDDEIEDDQDDDEEVEPTDLDLTWSEEPSATGACPANGEEDAEGNDDSDDTTDGEGDE